MARSATVLVCSWTNEVTGKIDSKLPRRA